jgi:hypothetical protein
MDGDAQITFLLQPTRVTALMSERLVNSRSGWHLREALRRKKCDETLLVRLLYPPFTLSIHERGIVCKMLVPVN